MKLSHTEVDLKLQQAIDNYVVTPLRGDCEEALASLMLQVCELKFNSLKVEFHTIQKIKVTREATAAELTKAQEIQKEETRKHLVWVKDKVKKDKVKKDKEYLSITERTPEYKKLIAKGVHFRVRTDFYTKIGEEFENALKEAVANNENQQARLEQMETSKEIVEFFNEIKYFRKISWDIVIIENYLSY